MPGGGSNSFSGSMIGRRKAKLNTAALSSHHNTGDIIPSSQQIGHCLKIAFNNQISDESAADDIFTHFKSVNYLNRKAQFATGS